MHQYLLISVRKYVRTEAPQQGACIEGRGMGLSLYISCAQPFCRACSLSLSVSLLNDTSPMMHLNVMMHLRMLQCRMAQGSRLDQGLTSQRNVCLSVTGESD